jgi:hypothetical protein
MAGMGIRHRSAGLVARPREVPQTDDKVFLEEAVPTLDALPAMYLTATRQHKPNAAAILRSA